MSRPTVEELTGRNSVSYSSLDTFQQCGEKFRLTRIHKVEQEQAYWNIGGKAFHLASEWYDKGSDLSIASLWRDAWDKEMSEVDTTKPLRAGGRATKQFPNKEDHLWWGINGPNMVADYIKWRANIGWEILVVDGVPIIEYDFVLVLPNAIQSDDASPNVLVQGYIDRVFVNGHGELVVCDLKTGAREPAASTQLGVYAGGIRQRLGMNPTLGAYYMARKGDVGGMVSLAHYTDELLSYWISTFEDSIRSQRFLPHVTSMCQTCTVAPSCYAVGGKAPYPLPFVNQ